MEVKDTGYCKTKREMQTLPNNLLQFRQQANISQDKLAQAVDCSRRTIGYIERGTHDPSVQMAYRIANYFKVALPVLFPDMNDNITSSSVYSLTITGISLSPASSEPRFLLCPDNSSYSPSGLGLASAGFRTPY